MPEGFASGDNHKGARAAALLRHQHGHGAHRHALPGAGVVRITARALQVAPGQADKHSGGAAEGAFPLQRVEHGVHVQVFPGLPVQFFNGLQIDLHGVELTPSVVILPGVGLHNAGLCYTPSSLSSIWPKSFAPHSSPHSW